MKIEAQKEVTALSPKGEISIELEILQKNQSMIMDSINKLEKRIIPILKCPPKTKTIEDEKDIPLLVELAMKIHESNQQLEICNSRIIYMIDSCQL